MYKFLNTYLVVPALPDNLEKLRTLAYNLYWSWNTDIRELFKRIDRDLWDSTGHNPIMLLGSVSQERLVDLSHDDGFISHMDRSYDDLQSYLKEKTWYSKNYPGHELFNIVYFSAEFGLTECLQTYSGGLGVLAGDHLKAVSDLGIPLTGIGLLYKEGYFQQYLDSEGWQHERYELNDFDNLPMKLVKKENGETLVLSVFMADRDVYFQVWEVLIGRVKLYLLDTNIYQNNAIDRKITETLYGGNAETRIRQEIILGIGGIRTIYALGLKPMVCHMNEGHSAFLSLERIRHFMKTEDLSFKEAREIGFYSNIFTTHTPVPAGIDVFPNDLIEKYLGYFYRNELRISDTEFYSLGTIYRNEYSNVFNMAHLAMNTAGFINGVSKLHGDVSKKMWVSGFKDVPFNEIPIGYVTNGVHIRSHISREMEDLFKKYIGEKWSSNAADAKLWERIDKIPDEELWRIHERRRERLVAFARRRLIKQARVKGGSQAEIEEASEVLDPDVLTIGFARRFATYKRATLLFKDRERLLRLLNDKNRPIQLIFAGKAHPQDDEGKKFIQEIHKITKEENFKKKIVFIENYDINVASYLVQGCDVWLNNPRRPLEASGTSGMKIIANGGLNFSILDGWWVEGFDPELGFKIGNGEEYIDPSYQDEVEARQLYHELENNIIPLFYSRGEDNVQRKWIAMVKKSMKTLGPFFNTHRMVQEYFSKYYQAAFDKRLLLFEQNKSKVKEVSEWKDKVRSNWNHINLVNYTTPNKEKTIYVGNLFTVEAELNLGYLTPDDIEVQLYYGPSEKQESPQQNKTINMELIKELGNSRFIYKGDIKSDRSGQTGFTIRVLPKHPLLINPFELGLVYWAQ
ncbi:MAG TPA: alpha-glucan family phosphorylase [Ignavibacteriaceae bacterium]|nr:alpha-glucan family phosphorylase [Ignavibacteriaceae bacterium]